MDSSRIEKNVVFLNLCTVGKIYTPISSFLRKRVVNIVILELGPVSNERPGNFTFQRGIHDFLNPTIIYRNNSFSKILRNGNCSSKTVIFFSKMWGF